MQYELFYSRKESECRCKQMPPKVSFSQTVIDCNEISQSELNIDDKVRSNLFAWNGQFSPQFIEVLLNKYSKSEFLVVDPLVGSGTVLGECARQGLKAYGVELNVSAYYMAKTYEIANLSIERRNEVIERIDALFLSIANDDSIIETITSEIEKTEPDAYYNLLCTTVILLDIFYNDVTLELLRKKWDLLKHVISQIPVSKERIIAERGDSRYIKLKDKCADLLVTSPPYINVFNYHQKYRRSVEALGYNVLSIAKTEFGSNRKNRGNRFLTVIQYCIDMALSLKEACRICKTDARMIYVVGRESSVLGYSFCNSELVFNIGTEIFSLQFLLRQERVFKNRFGQMIYEDILHFSNSSSILPCDEEIICKAREIAIRMLHEKCDLDVENKNRPLLFEAIEKAIKIKPSEGIA